MKGKKKARTQKVKSTRSVANRYEAEMKGKSATYQVLKVLADGKERTDKVILSAKKIKELKAELRKKDSGSFDKLVIEYVTKPCKLDSAAKKAGLTKNTAYCPVNKDMREMLS